MDISNQFKKYLKEHIEISASLFDISEQVHTASNLCIKTLKNGGKIIFFGNGGSASDSQHLSSELIGRFQKDRIPLAAISLTTDTSAITAISNDYTFENIFSRQLSALGKKGDCVFALSTSGNSKNVLNAIKLSKEIGISSISLLGNNGGLIKSFSDIPIVVPSQSTARIQEFHIFIGHVICSNIEKGLGLIKE